MRGFGAARKMSATISSAAERRLVGAGLLDCGHRNFDAHDHRHSRHCFRRQPGISPARAGLFGGAGDFVPGAGSPLLPGRILHGLPAFGKAIWAQHEVGCGRRLSGYQGACGGRADRGHRQGGERGVRYRSAEFDLHRRLPLTFFTRSREGCSAVIWTDVIQFAIYLTGSLAAFFLVAARDSGRLARSHARGRRGGRKAARLRFLVQPYAKLYVLVRPDWRHLSDYGQPRDRSNYGAAPACGAK